MKRSLTTYAYNLVLSQASEATHYRSERIGEESVALPLRWSDEGSAFPVLRSLGNEFNGECHVVGFRVLRNATTTPLSELQYDDKGTRCFVRLKKSRLCERG